MDDDISLPAELSRRMQRSLEIAKRYRAGDPIEVIASDYGVALSTVIKHARKYGLAPRIRRAGELQEQAQVIIADYAGGTPLRIMEEKFSCHRKEIWKIVKAAGLPGRRSPRRSPT
jgi:transposase